MRWVTCAGGRGDPDRVGVVVDGEVRLSTPGPTLRELLELGPERLMEIGTDVIARPAAVAELAAVRLRAPLEPPTIRDFVGFLDHIRNAKETPGLDAAWDEIPGMYFSNPYAVIGPYDPVPIPPACGSWPEHTEDAVVSRGFDFELEVGAVIGRRGADLAPEHAGAHIVGYTIFCDWSARDLQRHEARLGLGPAKGKDSASTLGPMLVTADELDHLVSGPSLHLEMRAFVNGDRVGGGWLDEMDWSFGELAAYASRGTEIRPGDVLGSGTVPTGSLVEHFVAHPATFRGWLAPGDVVRLEVDGLGHVEQEVVMGREPQPLRASRVAGRPQVRP
jgi:2-keto-4-pentenoate hydratase/2-oxohepta-3-ene-1,7-dioic acid hydratase in catechol pathway